MDKLGFPYEKRVNIEDMPEGKTAEDYPDAGSYTHRDVYKRQGIS